MLAASCISRKEVIQPHLPIRLPLLRLHPVMIPTGGKSSSLRFRLTTSGKTHSHGVTGGVYKAAGNPLFTGHAMIPRLLANCPTSCSRVADYNPDYDRAFSGIGSPRRVGDPLYRPLYYV